MWRCHGGDDGLVCNVPVTTILSIQSTVAYGHVGNSAATFPLMRIGVEVWPVITVRKEPLADAKEWEGKPGKLPLLER